MIWAVVLAAGESRRMGTQKLLLPFGEATVVEAVVRTALASRVDRALAVLGADRDAVRLKLEPYGVDFTVNEDFAEGMLSSVQAGLKALPADAEAAVVMLGDQPFLPARVVDALVAAYRGSGKGIVVPAFRGRRGHPVLISLEYRDEVIRLDPAEGLRQLMRAHSEDIFEAETGDANILRDLDVPEDYAGALDGRASRQGSNLPITPITGPPASAGDHGPRSGAVFRRPGPPETRREVIQEEKMTGSGVRVLYENGDLLAVDKPEGVVSIGEAGKGGLPELLKSVFPGKLYPVHRLDRGASGVIVFAKSAEAHRRLNGQFDRREVRKTYLALVHGVVDANRGSINAPIREFGSGRMGVDARRGKPSSTEWKVAERLPGATLLRVQPATGRRHQIRVHLYHIGHPIVGDLKYGDLARQQGFPRLMLHALEIEFALPSGERVTVEAHVPSSFEEVLGGLRKGRP